MMEHMVRAWATVNADLVDGGDGDDPGLLGTEREIARRWEAAVTTTDSDVENPATSGRDAAALPPGARDWVVPAIEEVMRRYCARRKKRLYCDKSLDSVRYLALVHALFPAARVILVFRHVMDTVASGIEASPWGFRAYGYAPYVQASPGNFVASLANYWLDHVTQALSWEQRHPEICHRVRYEDLVLAPEGTLAKIQRFLGVPVDLSGLTDAFARKPVSGPGDYKIEYTTSVDPSSIGRGKRIPVWLLPPPLLSALNEQLGAIGYEPLDRGWNATERGSDGHERGIWADRLVNLIAEIDVGVRACGVTTFALVAEDHRSLRWVINPDAGTIEQGDGDVEAVLTGTAEDLVLMLSGEENLGVLIRSGRVRHIVGDEERESLDLRREMNAIVELLRLRRPHSPGDGLER